MEHKWLRGYLTASKRWILIVLICILLFSVNATGQTDSQSFEKLEHTQTMVY